MEKNVFINGFINDFIVEREREFSYPIVFRKNFGSLAETVAASGKNYSRLCIITDSNVAPLYLSAVQEELRRVSPHVSFYIIPAGEENKHLGTVEHIYQFLIEQGMDRKGALFALGGGVVGDITGFAAATFLRGIDFIQIPTTLLAQVDSSVGGKTGVDLSRYKNMIGAFHQPALVYMNISTLKTLPDQEFICGMGEVVKTGLICDGAFFRRTVEAGFRLRQNEEELSKTVRRCCEIKAEIVQRDPLEKGDRALLNLGHTAGHAIEKLKNFALPHGQCVGIGLVAAAALSMEKGTLSSPEFDEIRSGLTACGLPVTVSGLSAESILEATRKDKKMDAGQIRFILMDGIGKSYIDRTVTDEELLSAIRIVTRQAG